MATSKKTQSKAGLPATRRGQQMGDARSSSSAGAGKEAKAATPPARGRRKEVNKFSADDAAPAAAAGDAARARTVSPSVPAALPTGRKLGESNAERAGQRLTARKGKSK